MKMTTLEITTYRIKLVMKETGLSQAELARRLDVAQQTVQKWAKGISSPTTTNMDKLSDVTGRPPYWFLLPPDIDGEGVPGDHHLQLKADERRLLELYREFPDVESKNMLLVFEMRLKELKKIYSKYFESRDK